MSTTIGERLREAREARGWSLTQVEAYTGIPNSSLATYENGKASVPGDRVAALAALYGVAADWLLTGAETAENLRRRWPKGFDVFHQASRELRVADREHFVELAGLLVQLPDAIDPLLRLVRLGNLTGVTRAAAATLSDPGQRRFTGHPNDDVAYFLRYVVEVAAAVAAADADESFSGFYALLGEARRQLEERRAAEGPIAVDEVLKGFEPLQIPDDASRE